MNADTIIIAALLGLISGIGLVVLLLSFTKILVAYKFREQDDRWEGLQGLVDELAGKIEEIGQKMCQQQSFDELEFRLDEFMRLCEKEFDNFVIPASIAPPVRTSMGVITRKTRDDIPPPPVGEMVETEDLVSGKKVVASEFAPGPLVAPPPAANDAVITETDKIIGGREPLDLAKVFPHDWKVGDVARIRTMVGTPKRTIKALLGGGPPMFAVSAEGFEDEVVYLDELAPDLKVGDAVVLRDDVDWGTDFAHPVNDASFVKELREDEPSCLAPINEGERVWWIPIWKLKRAPG